MTGQKPVQSIIRAVDILKEMAQGQGQVIKISDRLGLSKSTVHRMLTTLADLDLVRRDPVTRRYYLGPLIYQLSSLSSVVKYSFIVSCSQDEMTRLRDLSGETVNIQIRLGTERMCLGEVPSLENLKYISGIGSTQPLYVGSAGKLLLAHLTDEEVAVVLKNCSFVKVGPNTIADPKVLLEEIEKVRRLGYSTSFGERIAGSASISVPVKNAVTPLSLNVVGPRSRFSDESIMGVLGEMRKSADRISKRIGGEAAGKIDFDGDLSV